ncbi:MAG TPA: DUF523 domain-containing protein [Vulgatibacter sp.]|nr:DUF523 domain-containing protein [Vulgatibacter sp.]
MEKILISACFLGERVRYDGRDAAIGDGTIARWKAEGRLVPICPEVAGGLPIPRPAAELRGGDGRGVWAGGAKVVTIAGADVTEAFRSGARAALELAVRHEVRVAVLKQRSPSCGSSTIYDGSFEGKRIPGVGVTAALLAAEGVRVFSEDELAEADRWLRALEAR